MKIRLFSGWGEREVQDKSLLLRQPLLQTGDVGSASPHVVLPPPSGPKMQQGGRLVALGVGPVEASREAAAHPPLSCCVTWGRSVSLSGPQGPVPSEGATPSSQDFVTGQGVGASVMRGLVPGTWRREP